MIKRYYTEDESKFKNIINSLNELPRISAPDDFDSTLKHRINMLDSKVPGKKEVKSRRFIYGGIPLVRLFYPVAFALSAAALYFVIPITTPDIQNQGVQSIRQQAVRESDTLKTPQSPVLMNRESKGVSVNTASISGNKAVSKTVSEIDNNSSKEVASVQELKRRLLQFGIPGMENDVDKSLRAKPQYSGSGYQEGSQNVNFQNYGVTSDDSRALDELLKSRRDSMKRYQH